MTFSAVIERYVLKRTLEYFRNILCRALYSNLKYNRDTGLYINLGAALRSCSFSVHHEHAGLRRPPVRCPCFLKASPNVVVFHCDRPSQEKVRTLF